MSKRLLALNALLGVTACLLAAALVREIVTPRPLPPPSIGRSGPNRGVAVAEGSASGASTPDLVSPGGYGIIAVKNLFNPTRSEAQPGPAGALGPKPFLHGVIVDGSKSLAFLEDPAVKRTFRYAVGDTIGGGRVQSIASDRVVIARPDGLVEVLLHDPSKPRPTVAVPVTGQVPATAPPPGGPRPAAMTMPPFPVPGVGVPVPGLPPGANPMPPTPGR